MRTCNVAMATCWPFFACATRSECDSVPGGHGGTGAAMDWSLGSFGDLRLDKRGGAILEQMVVRKTVCLRRLGGGRGGELRAGRFFANPKVTGGGNGPSAR